MTLASKEIINVFYGVAPKSSYLKGAKMDFTNCSVLIAGG
jgi:hypothetical protein